MTQVNKEKPTAISFFSGAGGMDAGFFAAGFDVKLAIEIDPSCCDTLRNNLPQTMVANRDINEISAAEICELSSLKVGQIDCIFGGPPCQSFSLAGRREGLNDERGMLVFKFIELVRELKPKTFVLENVKGMVSWQAGTVLRKVEQMFAEPLDSGEKYSVQHLVLNSADYGVPQNRERVFIVGSRLETAYRFPEPTHGARNVDHERKLEPHVTVGQALEDLPKADAPSKTALRVSKTIKGRIEKHGY
ncbi:DNA cytosine methyltransferase [Octadecabacter sp. R77987]|uniref:DNA cytosine methyltransferase n=1 Tax=Octadecabacter sp. R77987 TaxID=3093874 RepID=UPI00366E2133